MSWPGPILTDSGGFQVFSLAKIRKITAHGVAIPFAPGWVAALSRAERSHGNPTAPRLGHRHGFRRMSAPRLPAKAAQEAVARTLRWAAECRAQPRLPGQAVFGIVQGGVNPRLARSMRPRPGGDGFRRLRHRRSERGRAGA